MTEDIDGADIEGAIRILQIAGYPVSAEYLERAKQRIANLTAALADSQAYNQHLVGQLAKKQNENNQLQERLEAAVARIADLEQTILYLTA